MLIVLHITTREASYSVPGSPSENCTQHNLQVGLCHLRKPERSRHESQDIYLKHLTTQSGSILGYWLLATCYWVGRKGCVTGFAARAQTFSPSWKTSLYPQVWSPR